MNANKLFSEFSLKKIWDKLLQHDKAMNSTLLILSSGNWIEQEDGTFKNTVSYSTFKDTDRLTVDLYDDGNLSETQIEEYTKYIDNFEIIDGGLVASANTKPTQTMTLVVKGDFETLVVDMSDITSEFDKMNDVINNEIGQLTDNITNEIDTLINENAQLHAFVEDVNERLIYIEENLGTLTTEEYTCSGTVGFSGDWYTTFSTFVTFNRIFVEPPTVSVVITYNKNNKFDNARAENITTTGCNILVDFHANYEHNCTLKWTAIGLVRKQTN